MRTFPSTRLTTNILIMPNHRPIIRALWWREVDSFLRSNQILQPWRGRIPRVLEERALHMLHSGWRIGGQAVLAVETWQLLVILWATDELLAVWVAHLSYRVWGWQVSLPYMLILGVQLLAGLKRREGYRLNHRWKWYMRRIWIWFMTWGRCDMNGIWWWQCWRMF